MGTLHFTRMRAISKVSFLLSLSVSLFRSLSLCSLSFPFIMFPFPLLVWPYPTKAAAMFWLYSDNMLWSQWAYNLLFFLDPLFIFFFFLTGGTQGSRRTWSIAIRPPGFPSPASGRPCPLSPDRAGRRWWPPHASRPCLPRRPRSQVFHLTSSSPGQHKVPVAAKTGLIRVWYLFTYTEYMFNILFVYCTGVGWCSNKIPGSQRHKSERVIWNLEAGRHLAGDNLADF